MAPRYASLRLKPHLPWVPPHGFCFLRSPSQYSVVSEAPEGKARSVPTPFAVSKEGSRVDAFYHCDWMQCCYALVTSSTRLLLLLLLLMPFS